MTPSDLAAVCSSPPLELTSLSQRYGLFSLGSKITHPLLTFHLAPAWPESSERLASDQPPAPTSSHIHLKSTMRSFYVCTLFLSGILLLSSDCASAARMDDSNDDMDWMDPIHELKAKLGHTGAKLREKWSKTKPARIMKHALKDLKDLPHEVKMYTIVHTLQAGKLDVRRIDAPGELLSKDFCRFVRHLHRNTEHSDPDAAVLFFFRTRLLENEVAILISRAKLFEENAVHMQKALFKQWFQRKLDVNGVKELFTKPYAWQWGDDVYVQDIVSSYRKYLHHRRRSTARHAG